MDLDTIFKTYQQKFQSRTEKVPENNPDILMEEIQKPSSGLPEKIPSIKISK